MTERGDWIGITKNDDEGWGEMKHRRVFHAIARR